MPPSLHELITTPKPSNANGKLLQQAHNRFDSSPVFASPSEGVSCDGCLSFCTCSLWPWFGPPLVALWYVVYFRFCGCHVFILDFSVLVFSIPTHFATLYFTFPYLHFPVLAISAPPFIAILRTHTWAK